MYFQYPLLVLKDVPLQLHNIVKLEQYWSFDIKVDGPQ